MKSLCAGVVLLLAYTNVADSFHSLDGLVPFTNTVPLVYSVPLNSEHGDYTPCTLYITDDVVTDFRVNIYKFITASLRKAVVLNEGHLVYSPYTAWLTMSALAEGAEDTAREELFRILSLPEDRCLRQMFYKIATTREFPTNDIVLGRRRDFIVNSSLFMNKNWENFARQHTQLNTVHLPFKDNDTVIDRLRRTFKAKLDDIDLSGNSFLLESLDFHGLWASAFGDAIIETGPFYTPDGEEIGTMEYMKINKRVNIGYAKSAKLKFIEIPMGRDGRYKMYFGMILNKDMTKAFTNFEDDLIFEVLSSIRTTSAPIDIMIPRFSISNEMDMRKLMEELGASSLWTEPFDTRNISNPSAIPTAFIQRVSVSVDNTGVTPPLHEYYLNQWTPQEDQEENPEIFKDFIANKPFLAGLFDTETHTILFGAVVSKIDF